MSLHKLLDRASGYGSTTDGTTWVPIITYTPLDDSIFYINVYIIGKDASFNGAIHVGRGAGNKISGTTAVIGSFSVAINHLSAALITTTIRVTFSGGDILIEVKGVAATTIEWMADFQIQVI